jgi:shikimate kinase
MPANVTPESGLPLGGAIVVVGAPGSGKSTVGRLLADRLGLPFIDVDQVIEERAGKPIGEIFADDGEPAFRELETAVTLELLVREGVLSLGGGAVTSERIRQALTGHRVIWLKVSAGAAARRVGLNTARPLLLGNVHGTLVKLMAERQPLYAAVATESVETDDLDPDAVVAGLAERVSS